MFSGTRRERCAPASDALDRPWGVAGRRRSARAVVSASWTCRGILDRRLFGGPRRAPRWRLRGSTAAGSHRQPTSGRAPRPHLSLPPLAFVGPDDVADASKPPRFQLVSELGDDVEAPGFCGPQQRGCEPGFDVDCARRYPGLVWPGGCARGRDVSRRIIWRHGKTREITIAVRGVLRVASARNRWRCALLWRVDTVGVAGSTPVAPTKKSGNRG